LKLLLNFRGDKKRQQQKKKRKGRKECRISERKREKGRLEEKIESTAVPFAAR
jgi:hypothetical protein